MTQIKTLCLLPYGLLPLCKAEQTSLLCSCFIRQLPHTKSRLSAAKVDKRPVCGKDKNLVNDNVLVYNFIEVLLAPSDKGGKDRHQ